MTRLYDASVTNLGALNGWLLNIGHHTAHHSRPSLHWTALLARTAAILSHIPDACIVPPTGVSIAAIRESAAALADRSASS